MKEEEENEKEEEPSSVTNCHHKHALLTGLTLLLGLMVKNIFGRRVSGPMEQ